MEAAPGEEGHEREQVGRHRLHVQCCFQVQDVVGEEVVLQQSGAMQLADMVWDGACLLGDVCQLQPWHAGECLRRVWRLLHAHSTI